MQTGIEPQETQDLNRESQDLNTEASQTEAHELELGHRALDEAETELDVDGQIDIRKDIRKNIQVESESKFPSASILKPLTADQVRMRSLEFIEEPGPDANRGPLGEASEEGISATLQSEPLSLPAALCDDLLLEEINSIPDKMGFKIGDVADILGIKQYVLRYWESEFDILRPKKAANNQRMYSRKDVENALLIRKLLHRDRFSIEGARNALKELKAHVRKEKDYSQVFVRLENFHDRIEDLAREIRHVRRLFKT